MADDRYRNFDDRGDNRGPRDDGRDYGSGRTDSYSNARFDQAAGQSGDRNFRGGGTGYGDQSRDRDSTRDSSGGVYGGGRSCYSGQGNYSGQGENHGSYASDGRRFTETGQRQNQDRQDYGRQPEGYNYQDRGFAARAGDEVRSWFGDDDAARRRDFDARRDNQGGDRHGSDDHYHSWRRTQIESLDRDYDEYRRENAKKFENEFGSWRSNRQTQRSSLERVNEHMDVVGSDGEHVGTVDKVRGDRIILTRNDAEAGGRHHSIPSNWIRTVDDKVTIGKTADEAKRHWRDEERSSAFFGSGDEKRDGDQGRTNLNRAFSGTY